MNGDAAFASSFLCFGIFSADLKKLHLDSAIILDFAAYGAGDLPYVIMKWNMKGGVSGYVKCPVTLIECIMVGV